MLRTLPKKKWRNLKFKKIACRPRLVQRLRVWPTTNSYSLDPQQIPPLSAPWSTNDNCLPFVTATVLNKYASLKKEGNQGQMEKVYRMLHGQDTVTSKVNDTVESFVINMMKRSYGDESYQNFVFFVNGKPRKAYCKCSVGASGLCFPTLVSF